MNNNTQQQSAMLCIECQQFFGNPANENLCSTCSKTKMFKNNNNSQQNNPQANILIQQQQIEKNETQNNNVDQKEENQNEKQKKQQQIDTNKCWDCNKKVGLYGIKCKCEYIYCNKHRMPEDHLCKYDFASVGKQLIKNANPLIQKSKLEKI